MIKCYSGLLLLIRTVPWRL